ncbi:MAG: dTMP kinase [Pseudomonadota bacterium]
MSQGYFITFEGGEGVGKTTQIKLLADFLKNKNHDVIMTREPGGTPAAEEIRSLLSHTEYGGDWTPEAELLMIFVARAQHIRDVIKPAIDIGKTVLCDRYIDSTRVYQGYLHKIPMDFIHNLENKIIGPYMPNLTLLLDLDENAAMERVQGRGEGDHYDQGDIHFYKELRNAFIDLASKDSERIKTIDAKQDIEAIASDIQQIVEKEIS